MIAASDEPPTAAGGRPLLLKRRCGLPCAGQPTASDSSRLTRTAGVPSARGRRELAAGKEGLVETLARCSSQRATLGSHSFLLEPIRSCNSKRKAVADGAIWSLA
jgi:hypothetical protein